MPRRMTEVMGEKIADAVMSLPVLSAIKDQIEWEVIASLVPVPDRPGALGVLWMVGIGVPATGGDYMMPYRSLQDPHDAGEISQVVAALYAEAQQSADEAQAQVNAALNGDRMSPGGLALP